MGAKFGSYASLILHTWPDYTRIRLTGTGSSVVCDAVRDVTMRDNKRMLFVLNGLARPIILYQV